MVPDHDLVVNQNSYSSLHIVCLFGFLISLFMHGRDERAFCCEWERKEEEKGKLVEFLAKKGYLRHIPKKKIVKITYFTTASVCCI